MIAFVLAASILAQATESYEDVVARGLAAGHAGDLGEARRAFDAAIARDPGRPEAWVERGGASFLEKDYEAAARDLKEALRRREDDYARDLLASSLQLAGRGDEALAVWNPLGRPRLAHLEITGLVHTLDRVARREVPLHEGDVVTLERVREARLRLAEVGVFDRVTVRPVPLGEGRANLDVALVERYGLFQSPVDLALNLGTNLLFERVRPRYANIAGGGLTVGGQYRWEQNRPDLSLFVDWPRPLGLDAAVHLGAFRGRQLYDVSDDPLLSRARGLDLGVRHVVAGRFVAQLALRMRDRSFSRSDPTAPPGRIVGVEGGLEHRWVETARQRLDASARLFAAGSALGSDLDYTRALLAAQYKLSLAAPEGTIVERSVFAAQIHWGRGSSGTPIDEMFAPGGSPDMELPLRAHQQTIDGALGPTPLGRWLTLANLEWRRRVARTSLIQVGVVTFCDLARIEKTSDPSDLDHSLRDVGVGLRLAVAGSSVVRLDYAHGLSDGKNAVFFGLNQIF
ncbi:MAG: POTRA domain-containing protein [Vicinamibacteria bacterium]